MADLETAKVNLKGDRFYAVVFFCHQAVEKGLKAYVLKRSKNPHTPEMMSHSLIFLGKASKIPKKFYSFLRELTSEYVNTRYPSAGEEPPESLYDRNIASETLLYSKEVIAWIDKHL